jgi:hypothetical protein
MAKSQIFRATKAGLVEVESEIDLRPTTTRGTLVSIQGRPRQDLTQGGVHLLLYPAFKRWLGKSAKHRAQWEALPDRRHYTLLLCSIAMLPTDTNTLQRPLFYCYRVAPDLTLAALLVLRPRAEKITREAYHAATVNPTYGDEITRHKLTANEASIRKRARESLEHFIADTQ